MEASRSMSTKWSTTPEPASAATPPKHAPAALAAGVPENSKTVGKVTVDDPIMTARGVDGDVRGLGA